MGLWGDPAGRSAGVSGERNEGTRPMLLVVGRLRSPDGAPVQHWATAQGQLGAMNPLAPEPNNQHSQAREHCATCLCEDLVTECPVKRSRAKKTRVQKAMSLTDLQPSQPPPMRSSSCCCCCPEDSLHTTGTRTVPDSPQVRRRHQAPPID